MSESNPNPILRYFEFDHLPNNLKKVSQPCCELAFEMEHYLPDGPEKSAGLRKLLEAKDCFVRAMLGLMVAFVLSGCLPHPSPPCVPYPGQPCSEVTPVPTPSSTPVPTQVPPVQMRQLTQGKAVFEIDLTGFTVPAPVPNPKAGQPGEPNELQLDSFAAVTGAWVAPRTGPKDRYPSTPAFQLGLRGTDPSPCIAKPCAGKVALEVRFSSNIAYDRTLTDESRMCGAGTRPSAWLPLGPGPRVRVVVEWGPGFFRASTPFASWQTSQGAAGPGFGWWVEGIPPDGLGWSYKKDWTLQAHGGSARLLALESTAAEQPPLGFCP